MAAYTVPTSAKLIVREFLKLRNSFFIHMFTANERLQISFEASFQQLSASKP